MGELFCVECGTEGPTQAGLCANCFAERRVLLTPPERVDLPRCVHCGSFLVGARWGRIGLSAAVHEALLRTVQVHSAVTSADLTEEIHHEDETNKRIAFHAVLHVEAFDVARDFETKLTLKGATCISCSRQRGSYYEAILQLRGTERPPAEAVRADALRLVEDGIERTPDAFIMKVQEVRGGTDIYLSSKALAKSLARTLRDTYGAETKSSPKLQTRKDGKDVYRVTYLIRIPTDE